jgi:hypothetical protein
MPRGIFIEGVCLDGMINHNEHGSQKHCPFSFGMGFWTKNFGTECGIHVIRGKI